MKALGNDSRIAVHEKGVVEESEGELRQLAEKDAIAPDDVERRVIR
jgi:hypothetical protein